MSAIVDAEKTQNLGCIIVQLGSRLIGSDSAALL